MIVQWSQIEPLLMQVAKPARYVGGEFNQVVKPNARMRCALAFPDLYELGMSYHGFRLLYELINAQPDWAAERVYAPWMDFEKLMREHKVPLYSLETRRSLDAFDWIGFTLQHEVNFTNILTMIDLAGLPLESRERTAPFPILVGGGEGAYSPEPLSPFLDAFVLGDGEHVTLEICALLQRARAEDWERGTILKALAQLPGVYVPQFYEVAYKADGRIESIEPVRDEKDHSLAPAAVHRRLFDVGHDLGSIKPVVPLLRTVHDRLVIEIRRGCVNGCRFCQAGMINRPVNERPLEQIVEIARQGLENTGYDEVSLLSLSSADYTLIKPLVERMSREFGPRGVSVSLPSLRINGFDVELVDKIAKVRKTGFTFAPEAGTTRLRQVINKPVDQERFFEIIEDVFRRGWRTVKFYFMIGLPTETDEDLDGIVEICEQAAQLGGRYHGKNATVNVTLSPFVPKSNTPFQWEGQVEREELLRRYRYVRDQLRQSVGRRVEIRSADMGASFFEAILARGDRRMAAVVRRAWELGARFDGWEEVFNLDLWLRAFEEIGLDPAFYANRRRDPDEMFPFEHLHSDVGRRFLEADARRSQAERAVDKCDTGRCAGCEICNDAIAHTLAQDFESAASEAACEPEPSTAAQAESRMNPVQNEAMEPVMDLRDGGAEFTAPVRRVKGERKKGQTPYEALPPVMRLRLAYTKLGALRYLSHLDFGKILGMILRRIAMPMAYTQGFNPQPRLQYAPPLSLGMGSQREYIDLFLIQDVDPAVWLERLNSIVLDGLTFLEAQALPVRGDSLENAIESSAFLIEPQAGGEGWDWAALERALGELESAQTWPVEVEKKGRAVSVDLKPAVAGWRVLDQPEGRALELTISHAPGAYVKPHEALGALVGRRLALGVDVRITRRSLNLAAAQPAQV